MTKATLSTLELGEVIVQLHGARRLTAIVTNEAVQDLELTVGDPCCALIKASHVILAVND